MDEETLNEVLGRGRLDRATALDELIPLDRDL
jgi:hypothetical protein